MNKMIAKNLRLAAATLAGGWLWLTALPTQAQEANFIDYDALTESIARRMEEYMAETLQTQSSLPTVSTHAMRTDNKVYVPQLPQPGKKTLETSEIVRRCRPGSLLVCGAKTQPQGKVQTWPIASAAALTADGICVTNYHVLFDQVLAGLTGYTLPDHAQRMVADEQGHVYPIRQILAADPVNDFVIFRADVGTSHLVPLPMGHTLAEGEEVYCLSHTRDLPFYLTRGIVSRNTRSVNRRNGHERLYMQITADFGVGASGGPILDKRGNLVGIVGSTTSMYADQQNQRNFQLSVKNAIPIRLIRECFSATPPNPQQAVSLTPLPEQVPEHKASYGIRYRHTHVMDTRLRRTYEEERVLWVAEGLTLDTPCGPLCSTPVKPLRQTPTFFYYYPQAKRLLRTAQVLDKEYLLSDVTQTPIWDIATEDFRIVNGYVCRRAMSSIGGRRWTAWFTNDLPGKAAPRHLTGLPGVVIEAHDDAREVSWEMQEVVQPPLAGGEGFWLSPTRLQASSITAQAELLVRLFGLTPLAQVRETFFPTAQEPPSGVLFPSGGKAAFKDSNPIER